MDYKHLILQQLEALDLDPLFQIGERIRDGTGLLILPELEQWISQFLSGDMTWDWQPLLSQLMRLCAGQLRDSLSSCAMILIICILSGLLNSLTDSFGKHTVSKIGKTICMLTVSTIVIRDFIEVFHYCVSQTDLMIVTVQSLFPVLIPLTVASGKTVTGTILNPAMVGVIAMISTIMDQWILPAVYFSGALCLTGRLIDQSFLRKSGKLLKDAIVYSVGLTVTVLSAFTTIQGSVGKAADSILMKTARFSVDNFIPVIGGFAADSMDMVLSCTGMIKSVIGIWGVLMLLAVLVTPLVKMGVIILIYRVCSILAEALTDQMTAGFLEEISSTIMTLTVIYTLMGILFIVFLSIITIIV
ncbi:MAG: stage III sporulation protein AE [Firmicutes bacterium]|nr:stage III sporulation protein AE [Bacillota bacterium]